MKKALVSLGVALVMLAGLGPAMAADLKDKVKVQVDSVGQHPGMDPGLYVCALGHLHIRGTVHNVAGVTVGQVKVAGKAFDADGKLLGTAVASTKPSSIRPDEKAEINLEFLTVAGPLVQQVKRHEVSVVEAPAK